MGGGVGIGLLAVGVLAGECVAASFGGVDGWPLGAIGAAIAISLGRWAGGRWAALLRGVALVAGAAALGMLRMATVVGPDLPACHVARLALPRHVRFGGRVVATPERQGDRTRLLVEAERVGGRRACGLVRVTVRQARRPWQLGSRIRGEVTLRQPRNFVNPGAYDLVGHLARQGIRATAFVWDDTAVRIGRARGSTWRIGIAHWRERVMAAMWRVPSPGRAVLRALVVGDEGEIDEELRTAFARAGVVHVLSVSGLHVGLVAIGAFAVVRWALARSEFLLLTIDVGRVAALASLGPVLLYAALAGWQVATVRSVLMIGVAVAARVVGRTMQVTRSLAIAALAMALVWPGVPLEIAFQLSFASVLAIAVATSRWGAPMRPAAGSGRVRWWVCQAVVVSVAAAVGTAPLTAFHFHQVSFAGVAANPVVVPLFGTLIVGLGLAGALIEPLAPGLASWMLAAAGELVRPGIALVRGIGDAPWAAADVPIPSPLEIGLVYALLGGIVLCPRVGGRWLAGMALVGILADGAWWAHTRWGNGELRISFLDVGQGDAAVVEFPNGRVLCVDAGGMAGGAFDTGAAVVGPFLWSRKVRRLDAVLVTHAHPDHFGGVPYLLAHFHPRELWAPASTGAGDSWQRLVRGVTQGGIAMRTLDTGSRVDGFGAGMSILNPERGAPAASVNDTSVVLEVEFGRVRVLLTGDIEAPAEQRLLVDRTVRSAVVLKVPHHGSRTSSTAGFVARVVPQVAIISAGADNRYGLPVPEVEARYRAAGACVLRTDRCGAITVRTDGRGVHVEASVPACTCPGRPDIDG